MKYRIHYLAPHHLSKILLVTTQNKTLEKHFGFWVSSFCIAPTSGNQIFSTQDGYQCSDNGKIFQKSGQTVHDGFHKCSPYLEAWCAEVAGDDCQRQQQCSSGPVLQPVSCKELTGPPEWSV